MIATETASTTTLVFKRFAERHEAVNRWFRSTELAYRLARMLIDGQDSSLPVRRLFKEDWRRKDTLKQYRGRFSEIGRVPQASIYDFKLDLFDGWPLLLESVIVQEASALEIFLREWILTATQEALVSSQSHSVERIVELQKMADDVTSEPYQTISLERVSKLFPTLRRALDATTHLRSKRPLLSSATGGLSCRVVADLWRAVRNLIIHHDRIVHAEFFKLYSRPWLEMQEDARARGARIVPRPCVEGKQLPVVVRHVVFCLTSCYQTAVVLHIATGGEVSRDEAVGVQ